MINQFTKQEFEQALHGFLNGTPFGLMGLVDSEECYTVRVNPYARLFIRSSVDTSGVAANTGENSIRLWLQVKLANDTWRATGKPSQNCNGTRTAPAPHAVINVCNTGRAPAN